MNKYTQSIGGNLARRKSEALLENARLAVSNTGDVNTIIGEIQGSVKKFYEKLQSPITEPFQLDPSQPRSYTDYMKFLSAVKTDLNILHGQSVETVDVLAKTFNYITSLNDALQAKALRISSQAEDLALLSGIVATNIFVGGDRFTDDSKVDKYIATNAVRSEVVPGGGAVTLNRVSVQNVVSPQKTKVDVQTGPEFPYDPAKNISGQGQDDPNKDYRVHEGHYFTYSGRIEPAGGVLRWISVQVDPSGKEVEPGTFVSSSGDASPEGQQRRDDVARLKNTKTVIVPDIPTIQELMSVRAKMFDGDPSTYWQIESTYNPFSLTDEAKFREQFGSMNPQQRAEALRGLIRTTENRDFDVKLIVDLVDATTVNLITLNPENFGEEAWVEVTGIDTAVNSEGPWSPIEGLFDNKYENTLTPEANQELTDAEVVATLSPTRYAYAGQGLWHFNPREVRYIRIGLRQRTPVPSPYHVIRYKLTRHITTTVTRTRQKGLFS